MAPPIDRRCRFSLTWPPSQLVDNGYLHIQSDHAGQLSGTKVEIANGIVPEALLDFTQS
jgi:hypothetical protein